MDNNPTTIGEVAKNLGVSIDTLRRWDKNGTLTALQRAGDAGHRYYSLEQLEEYVKNNLFKFAVKWARNRRGEKPLDLFYCSDAYIFQSRLEKMGSELSKVKILKDIFSLLVAITGEIGNNSFEHNLGNWPDVRGIFFGYDTEAKKIALADRGQGILKTLKRVRPTLTNDVDALQTAFTEIISGRAPENRGNGLKFVRRVVEKNSFGLFFQSGGAELNVTKKNKGLKIKIPSHPCHGCLALIKF